MYNNMNTNESNIKSKDLNNSTLESQVRKDPKTMSLEELEAILNKSKIKSKAETKDDNISIKGLNNSQFSQKNYSFYEPQKFRLQVEDQHPILNNMPSYQTGNDLINSEKNSNSHLSLNFKALDKGITTPNRENFNISIFSEPVSDNEEKMTRNNLKSLNENLIPNSISTIGNNYMPTPNQSAAATSAMKAMQDRIKKLSSENDEIKRNNLLLQETLENERLELNAKILNEINKGNDIEKSLRKDISIFEEERVSLINNINELKAQNSLITSTIQILENEKSRHLEQNVIEKENLHRDLEQMSLELENTKKQFNTLSKENAKLKETMNKMVEDSKNNEKIVNTLKEEINNMKKSFNKTINDYNTEMENLKEKYNYDVSECSSAINSYKEQFKALEKEKNTMIKDYEKKIKEMNREMSRNDSKNGKIVMKPSISNNIVSSTNNLKKTGTKKISQKKTGNVDTKSIEKSRSRSKSEKKFKTNIKGNSSGKLVSKPAVQTQRNRTKIGDSYDFNSSGDNFKNNIIPRKNNEEIDYNPSISSSQRFNNMDLIGINQGNHDSSNINNMSMLQRETEGQNNLNKTVVSNDNLLAINDNIFGLERSIAELNRNYKNLLIKQNNCLSQEEIQINKKSINQIALSLKDQTERLVELKNKQQEVLKCSLKF